MNRYDQKVKELEGIYSSSSPDKPYISASEQQLDEIEAQLNFCLPADYREFLKDYGGYLFSNPVFPIVKDSGYPTEASVFVFYDASSSGATIAERHQDALESDAIFPVNYYPGLSLIREIEDWDEEIAWPAELLAIACDMGGNQICLAVSGLRPGAIFQWMNSPGDNQQGLYWIADSFDEFMQSIHLPE